MPRPLRLEYRNAFYHVMNRGRDRQAIFHGPRYYQAFLKSIEEANQQFGLIVHAYCLMPNHYHLLVQTTRDKLSRCMRHVNGVYTQRYNVMKQTDGPLFRGRYKATLVEADAYLLQLTRYIHRNPLEKARPLVRDLADYPWSSYPAFINTASAPRWLEREFSYELLGKNRKFDGYKRYINLGRDQELVDFYAKDRVKPILATESFIQRVREDANNEPIKHRLADSLAPAPDLATIVDRVAVQTGVASSEIVQSRRGRGSRNVPRWIAITIARDLSGLPLAEIARYFEMGHISGISKTVNKLREHERHDKKVAQTLKVLYQDLTP